MPKVSIMMPVYKVEKYLRQCLDSVVAQTLEDIEIIIVDEGEMDECRAIIDEFEQKDKRIKTIHEKNGSYGIALNKAMKLVTGEYVGIIETDDYIEPNMFEDLYNLAKQYDAEVVKSDWYEYYSKTNLSIQAGRILKNKANKLTNAKEDVSLLKIQPSIWSAIYKKEFLFGNNIKFIEKLKSAYQDTSFNFKIFALAKKVVLTDKAYVHYRLDSVGSTCNTSGNVFAPCDEYAEITRFLNENQNLKEEFNTQKLINEYNSYVWNTLRIGQDCRQEFVNKFSEIFKNYNDNGEIVADFFKKIKKKDFQLLLSNPVKFKKYMDRKSLKKRFNDIRRGLLTIRINSSRICISIFGKTILEVG